MDLTCHTFRTSGFNDLANGLFLGRVLAAGCGGWSEGTCVAKHYQRMTAADLAAAVYIHLRRNCVDLCWDMEALH